MRKPKATKRVEAEARQAAYRKLSLGERSMRAIKRRGESKREMARFDAEFDRNRAAKGLPPQPD